MQRLGAPTSAVTSMLSTLQQAKHHIITAYGPSKKYYGQHRHPPLQGLGQGNGAAPAGWTAVSTPLINMMRHAGFGLNVLSAISSSLLSFVCYAFVDDTDIIHSTQNDYPTLLNQMQNAVVHWEGGLRATGGALRVDKSFWYLIHFIWDKHQWRYATSNDTPGDIHVRGVNHDHELLHRLEPHEARETLSCAWTSTQPS